MHSYRQTGEKHWTVFFYGDGVCLPTHEFNTEEKAAAFASYLNGGENPLCAIEREMEWVQLEERAEKAELDASTFRLQSGALEKQLSHLRNLFVLLDASVEKMAAGPLCKTRPEVQQRVIDVAAVIRDTLAAFDSPKES